MVLLGTKTVPPEAWELFPFLVTIQPVTGRDRYNVPTYDPAVVFDALLDQKRRLVRSPAGEEIVSTMTVYLANGEDVPVESLVTLPSGQELRVLSQDRNADEFGWFITTLYL